MAKTGINNHYECQHKTRLWSPRDRDPAAAATVRARLPALAQFAVETNRRKRVWIPRDGDGHRQADAIQVRGFDHGLWLNSDDNARSDGREG